MFKITIYISVLVCVYRYVVIQLRITVQFTCTKRLIVHWSHVFVKCVVKHSSYRLVSQNTGRYILVTRHLCAKCVTWDLFQNTNWLCIHVYIQVRDHMHVTSATKDLLVVMVYVNTNALILVKKDTHVRTVSSHSHLGRLLKIINAQIRF